MKTEIKIPEDLSEITLAQYQSFIESCKDISGDLLRQRTVEHFCAIPLSQVLLIKLKDVTDISDHIDNIFSADKELVPTFTIGSVEFGFIPNIDDISWGEYIDLDNYVGDWETMHKAMAVLYRPITQKIKGQYLIEDYEGSDKYSEVMKLAPLNAVLGALVFFYTLESELLKLSLLYLTKQAKEEILAKSPSLINNGAGIVQSIESQIATLEDLRKSQSINYLPYLHSSPLNLKRQE
jgi:hypothetical protein